MSWFKSVKYSGRGRASHIHNPSVEKDYLRIWLVKDGGDQHPGKFLAYLVEQLQPGVYRETKVAPLISDSLVDLRKQIQNASEIPRYHAPRQLKDSSGIIELWI